MSETQNISGNSRNARTLPPVEDDGYELPEGGTLEDALQGDDQESDFFQEEHLTRDKMKDLQLKGSSHKTPAGKDQDLLGLLDEVGPDKTDFVANSPLGRAAQATGQDPTALQELLKKHGNLDINNLPNPPDDRVADLLNDPDYSQNIGELKQKVAEASQVLKDEIGKQTKAAKNLNDEAKKENNKERSNDDSSYRFLYDAHFHQDDKSKALIEAQKQLATETAHNLSTLYGKEVKADDNPEKAGTVSMYGTTFNVVGNSMTGEIKFNSKTTIAWPHVEVVPFELDNYGAGKTTIPEWMRQANYPIHVYDEFQGVNYIKQDWWAFMVPGIGSLVASGMGIDSLTKKGDDNIPTGGELKNIGIQSSGSDASQTKTES